MPAREAVPECKKQEDYRDKSGSSVWLRSIRLFATDGVADGQSNGPGCEVIRRTPPLPAISCPTPPNVLPPRPAGCLHVPPKFSDSRQSAYNAQSLICLPAIHIGTRLLPTRSISARQAPFSFASEGRASVSSGHSARPTMGGQLSLKPEG